MTSRLNLVVQSPTPFGPGRNGCWPSRGVPVTRNTPLIQTIFPTCCSLNNRRKAVHSLFEIGQLFSLFSLPCLSLSGLFIILLLLMSGNVHPNPGLVFPCLVYAGNVTCRVRSVQCCTCTKWVHLRRSLLSFFGFKTLRSSHFRSRPPCCISASSGGHIPTNTLSSSSGLTSLYTSTWSICPPLPFQRSHSTLAFKPPILLPPTSYLLSLHSTHPHMFTAVFLYLLLPLPHLTRSGFFNKMPEVFEPGALK